MDNRNFNDGMTARIAAAEELFWLNPKLEPSSRGERCGFGVSDIDGAQARLLRFAPFIRRKFPETAGAGGLIESPLTPLTNMRKSMGVSGRLLLKQDNALPISGSVKARGGIYEVLKHAETLALTGGLIDEHSDYSLLAEDGSRRFFSQYKLQVGSTGNLGMSIGIMGAAVGFSVTVHMSADAREWKKARLRQSGVNVVEYAGDYSEAVKLGRALSDADERSYFVDDENSADLFLGYAVAARRLKGQLEAMGVRVDGDHPLFVYIPCGVGGAPGGVTFGLKTVFGGNAHCFFAEPVQAPCMLLGMATGLHNGIAVQDIGLTGRTLADGLAVGRPSGLVGRAMEPLLSGEFTVKDARLYDDMRALFELEGIFLEPSACAALRGPELLVSGAVGRGYLERHGLLNKLDNAAHIVWATGGSLVPETVREEYFKTFPQD